ncbi:MAG TPA: hypothetical protein VFF34_01880 [Candidatus Nitrosocosmicus sp.]|nr:hypothetical protein [Candidatus Nitrosocosmicus sp.]
MITPRGYAIALATALDRDELQQLVDRLMDAAADLEIRADEERSKILARRADVLGALADAIDAEIDSVVRA